MRRETYSSNENFVNFIINTAISIWMKKTVSTNKNWSYLSVGALVDGLESVNSEVGLLFGLLDLGTSWGADGQKAASCASAFSSCDREARCEERQSGQHDWGGKVTELQIFCTMFKTQNCGKHCICQMLLVLARCCLLGKKCRKFRCRLDKGCCEAPLV